MVLHRGIVQRRKGLHHLAFVIQHIEGEKLRLFPVAVVALTFLAGFIAVPSAMALASPPAHVLEGPDKLRRHQQRTQCRLGYLCSRWLTASPALQYHLCQAPRA
jgi:hypothetical protein